MATDSEVSLTSHQRSELSSIAQSRTLPAGYVFRAKLILMLAEGASFNTIKRRLQTSAPTIIRWKQRFLESGLDGLDTYHPGQNATVLTPALRARILSATGKKPSDGSTHWSCRKLATALGGSRFISSSTTSPPTKPSWFATSCNSIRACSFTSPLRIPLGSTKSSSGSPRSNVRSLPAASSPLYLTWLANSVVTSTPTPPTLARSSGNTPTLLGAYVLTNSLRQATSVL
jgi:Homeodomain-like domain